jgi:hypothetical protein
VQELEEVALEDGEGDAGDDLEEVTKVVAGVERHPSDLGVEDEAAGDEELAKLLDGDALLLVPLEIEAGVGQELD